MSKQILVLSAQAYDFTDKETNKQIKGVNLHCVTEEQLNGERGLFGHQVVKLKCPDGVVLKQVPAYFKPTYTESITSKGIQLTLSSLEFIKPCELFSKSLNGAK